MSATIDTAIQAILQGKTPPSVPSRRSFPRYSASYPVLLEIAGSEVAVTGVTVNICRSGMLVRVRESMASGADCRITFLPRDDYRPELVECPHCASEFPALVLPRIPIRGTVVRQESVADGPAVAILFELPLSDVHEDDDHHHHDHHDHHDHDDRDAHDDRDRHRDHGDNDDPLRIRTSSC